MKICIQILVWIFLLFQSTAFAGPPFLSGDPRTLDYKHWAFYVYSSTKSSPNKTTVNVPMVALNYGVLPNLQFHVVLPGNLVIRSNKANEFGLGDMRFAVKFRFLQETTFLPQIAIYPSVRIPTGNANRDLGNGRVWTKVPIWLEKNWGAWRLYGGAGYAFNSAPNKQDYPYVGGVLQYAFTQKLRLGGEIFSQGRSSTNTAAYTVLDVGGSYDFTEKFRVLFRVGHSITGQETTVGYCGFRWNGSL